MLIEQLRTNGFRATGGEPFGLTAEGPTRDEALQRLQDLIRSRLANGAELVPLEIPAAEHPLAPLAGMYRDDPLFDEWQQAILDRRRELDADPNVP